ncbi:FtsX-like permease family protein [candidate division GN15 bacterium]|nr:FtsX-like permease family protein [candidate division GN15 bacterium]
MRFESFIARRYFSSGRFFVSVSTWITILGVTLGVAVVCFVMSLHNGFESEIRSRLLGTTSHISVFPSGQKYIAEYDQLVERLNRMDGVVAASPFIYSKAGISSASTTDGIVVRGIDLDLEAQTANIGEDILVGDYTFAETVHRDDTLPGILLGRGLADRLGTFVGQPVVLYAMSAEDVRTGSRPRVAKFYVAGIFETGMFEFDAQLAYVSIPAAQELFQIGDAVTSVHLKLTDIYLADQVAPLIDQLLDYRYEIVPWNELHKNIFSWIEFEKVVLFIGFILIVLVAGFSIISTLVMTTMEKRAEIGILKTIGTTPGEVGKIFVLKGLLIGVGGVLGGWLLAWAAAMIQNHYKVISLPPDIYFIAYVPIDVHPTDFLFAGGVTILICFLASIYPALQAARTSVIDVLRQ